MIYFVPFEPLWGTVLLHTIAFGMLGVTLRMGGHCGFLKGFHNLGRVSSKDCLFPLSG